jgi:adenylate cyclase
MSFEAHLSREIVQSERLRMAILAGLLAALVPVMLLFGVVFEGNRAAPAAIAVLACVVAYELAARYVLGRMLRQGRTPPAVLRYANALVETSVPSLLILLVARQIEPIVVLQGPAVFLYAIFIILSTLRLDFWLATFTGAVAAVEFAALSFAYEGDFDYSATAAVMSSPGFILGKALVLCLAGVVAGLVGMQLRRRIRRVWRVIGTFGQQVSPAIAEELLRQGPDFPSRRGFVCVMFMDVRGFTSLVENRSPEEIVALQNAVFGVAIEAVSRHHGVINQFLGDGFMATFGAPVSGGNDCANALAAAREIIARVTQVKVGIGLHAGEAVSGNVGTAERKQYSVTGNVVILASRIEQLNKAYGSQLLVSREVLERCGDVAATALGPVRVKGREQPVDLYRLV